MATDPRSPFNWRSRTEPSIFATDIQFRAKADGKNAVQMMGEAASKHLKTKQVDGKAAPVVHGLGEKSKMREAQLLAYKHFGTYSKAAPSVKHPNKHEVPNAKAKAR